MVRVGQNRIYNIYGVYSVIFGKEINKYTVIYSDYLWFWPTLDMMERGLVCEGVSV
jgi:hypothetical protein